MQSGFFIYSQMRVTFLPLSFFRPLLRRYNMNEKKMKKQKLWGISFESSKPFDSWMRVSKHTTTLRSSRFYPNGCVQKSTRWCKKSVVS